MGYWADLQPRRHRATARHGMPSVALPLLLLLMVLSLWAAGTPSLLSHAKDCVTRGPSAMTAWKYERGIFQCENCWGPDMRGADEGAVPIGGRRWIEYDKERRATNRFVEVSRGRGMVQLEDAARGLHMLLNSEHCGIREESEKTFRGIYQGTFVSVVDCT